MKEIVIKLSVNKIVDMLNFRLREDFDNKFIPKDSRNRIKDIVLKNERAIRVCGHDSVMEVINEGYNDKLDRAMGEFYYEIQKVQDKAEEKLAQEKQDEKDAAMYVRLKKVQDKAEEKLAQEKQDEKDAAMYVRLKKKFEGKGK